MIKFLDLKKINDGFEPELSAAIARVLNSGWYLLGNESGEFEREYSSFIGTKHCIGVANGLDALRLILKAYIEMGKMKEGDEIIVPANTYIASMLAITDNRLRPILVEPNLETYNIDPYMIEEKISSRTKGIMIVHLYGRNAMHDKIAELVKKYDLILIEDNAQAQGCYFRGKRTGSLGHAAGHSFYPGKNIGALGDAGAVTTDNDDLASAVRAIANYGSKVKYENQYKGLNSRLDEIQAAVLRVKLKRLDRDNNRRREIAEHYVKNIKNHEIILPMNEGTDDHRNNLSKPGADNLLAQPIRKIPGHVWHLFVIRTQHRNELQKYLSDNQIQTMIHYPVPAHRQVAYKEWNGLILPLTEQIHNQVLSLPISPVMEIEEAGRVAEVVNSYSSKSN